MKFPRALYIHSRFFVYLAIIAGGFVLAHWLPVLYPAAWVAVMLLIAFFALDILLLFRKGKETSAHRSMASKLSNGSENKVVVDYSSGYGFRTGIQVIDELPVQFQERNFEFRITVSAYGNHRLGYFLRPTQRGEYRFGHINIFVSSPLRLAIRRFRFQNGKQVAVYPNIIQMQEYDFMASKPNLAGMGFKKLRRIGHSQEFEQIKDYVSGDDIRTLNWKATAKMGDLMINQFREEKSRPVYAVLDTGRAMKMPFKGLSLLDYAINTTLAFSNVALKKHDKTGLITFSKRLEGHLPAVCTKKQLLAIMEKLYKIETAFTDSDFGLLYTHIKRKVNHRSLILCFTNFTHISAMHRQLPYLQGIAKQHVLVVIFFENTELDRLIHSDAEDIQMVYQKAIAGKFALEQKLIVKELNRHGILTLLTRPEKLTIDTLNKYLEIKARGLL